MTEFSYPTPRPASRDGLVGAIVTALLFRLIALASGWIYVRTTRLSRGRTLEARDDGVWEHTEPDWDEPRHVVTGHGPKTQERIDLRRRMLEQEAWVRSVVLAEAA